MEDVDFLGITVIYIIGSIVVAVIAATKGRSGFLWFLYALFLTPIAFIHVLFVGRPETAGGDPKRVPCPACKEKIMPGALKCPHCGNKLVRL